MDPAVVSALSALFGSAVGGSATFATAWLTQRTEGRRASIESEVRKRERLYVEFIAEGSKLLMEGLDHEFESPQRLYPLYSILNRIRLRCSAEVLGAADGVVTEIIESSFRPNHLTRRAPQALARPSERSAEGVQRGVCRSELRRLERGTP